MASTLPLHRRLQLTRADEPDPLVWIGGDAKLNGVAAGSWTDGIYAVIATADWEDAVRSAVAEDIGEDNIDMATLTVAIWELLCFLMIATIAAAGWTDKIVIYVSDNFLTTRWLTNMRAGNDFAALMVTIVALLMARFRFELYCFYIDTDNNPWDLPSRCFDPPETRKGPSRSSGRACSPPTRRILVCTRPGPRL